MRFYRQQNFHSEIVVLSEITVLLNIRHWKLIVRFIEKVVAVVSK